MRGRSTRVTQDQARARFAAGFSGTIFWRRSSPCPLISSTTPGFRRISGFSRRTSPPAAGGRCKLIDASSFCKPLRKKLGDKKNEISPENREAVTRLYTDFRENEFVKIFENEDFLYREYTVMRPQYDESGKVVRDRKGEIVYDKATKDKEIVPFKESIEDYMAREVLPHVPDAKAFFLEDLTKKKPVVKTGAEFPFTRYFYKYASLEPAAEIWSEIESLDREIAKELKALKEEA